MLLSYLHTNKIEVGLDEVGRGCLCGPVVAAAVILPHDFTNDIIDDSKKLTDKQRYSLVDVIKEAAIAYAIAEVSPQKIDQINILNASFLAMHHCLDQLTVSYDHLLVDGNRFTTYKDVPHTCVIKGDGKYYSIAAASILAKTYRDDLMKKLDQEFPGYGWDTNMGYPTKKHREAIRKQGVTIHHRKSFQLLPVQIEMFEE